MAQRYRLCVEVKCFHSIKRLSAFLFKSAAQVKQPVRRYDPNSSQHEAWHRWVQPFISIKGKPVTGNNKTVSIESERSDADEDKGHLHESLSWLDTVLLILLIYTVNIYLKKAKSPVKQNRAYVHFTAWGFTSFHESQHTPFYTPVVEWKLAVIFELWELY